MTEEGQSTPGRRLLLYGGLALGMGLLALAPRFVSRGPQVPPEEVAPQGRWRRSLERGTPPSGDPEELARVMSLPYVAGKMPAPGHSGVTFHDPERALPGVNLYTSGHAPEALLIDMEGRPLHRWRYRFRRAFPGKREDPGVFFFRRARLLPGGDLIALYQGGGLIRLDRDSNLVWALDAAVFNDFHVAGDGRIYTLAKEAGVVPEIHPTQPVLEDSVLVVGADGTPEERISLLAALTASPFRHLLEPMADAGDIFHSNTVQLLEDGAAEGPWRAGNLLVSLREIDLIAVVDPASRQAVWARRGQWKRQHEPVRLPNGRLLLFDNQGHGGYSQVLEIEPETGEVMWRWAGDPPESFSSPEAGTAARLPNGDTLITESDRGRAFEVTPEGDVVWSFASPHRAGSEGELVATLFEVERLPEEAVARWLRVR